MKWRPLKVLFIGDEPSSKNVSPTIPFVGTASYKRLLKWIGELDLDIKNVRMINTPKSQYVVVNEYEYDKLIFLGNKSVKEVLVLSNKTGYPDSTVSLLPTKITIDHPSPRNRKFNNPEYEKKMLKELKEWLYS